MANIYRYPSQDLVTPLIIPTQSLVLTKSHLTHTPAHKHTQARRPHHTHDDKTEVDLRRHVDSGNEEEAHIGGLAGQFPSYIFASIIHKKNGSRRL